MKRKEITLIQPDDFHLHIRNFPEAAAYLRETALAFKRAIIMPNTLPPIDSVERMLAYKGEIISSQPGFEPLMTFKLSESMNPDLIAKFKGAGALAGKLYPKGATTNSEDGCDSISEMYPLFEAMQDCGLVLSIHGEEPSSPVFERERSFLPVLKQIWGDFPRLKIVLEHLSTREAVETILEAPETVVATITLHHLVATREDMLSASMNPHYYCKPILQNEADRSAILQAAFSGNKKFFFGSDSAPHLKQNKENGKAAAGVYSAPGLLPALVQLFDENGELDKLEAFTSKTGAQFYGLQENKERITLINEKMVVPNECDAVVPFLAGKELHWSLKNDNLK